MNFLSSSDPALFLMQRHKKIMGTKLNDQNHSTSSKAMFKAHMEKEFRPLKPGDKKSKLYKIPANQLIELKSTLALQRLIVKESQSLGDSA